MYKYFYTPKNLLESQIKKLKYINMYCINLSDGFKFIRTTR